MRYLGTVTGGEFPVPFVRIESGDELRRVYPNLRGDHRGIFMVTRFGPFPVLSAAEQAGLFDALGLDVPTRLRRVMHAAAASERSEMQTRGAA